MMRSTRSAQAAAPNNGTLSGTWRGTKRKLSDTRLEGKDTVATRTGHADGAKTKTISLQEALAAAAETAARKPPSKFKPVAVPAQPLPSVPVVEGVVPKGASILIIQDPWISLILDGHKTWEIRGQKCNKAPGETIYLALSGAGGVILGSATFAASHGPLSRDEYSSARARHRVAGESLPYGGSTYAWELKCPKRFRSPVMYSHKPGVVVWAKM